MGVVLTAFHVNGYLSWSHKIYKDKTSVEENYDHLSQAYN